MTKLRAGIFGISAAILVAVDQWFKHVALMSLPSDRELSSFKFLTLAVHKNEGIAFNIPFSMPLIFIISSILGILLLGILVKNRRRHPDIALGALLILVGGLGNLVDRIGYGFTVDYIVLLSRLAINLSDAVILVGVVLFLLSSRRKKEHRHVHPDEPQYDTD